MANYNSGSIFGLDALAELENFDVEANQADLVVDDVLRTVEIAPVNQAVSGNVCIISANTVINGDMTSASPISVEGRVNGNITTSSDVGVAGLVVGDVKADNISFEHSGMRGNSTAAKDLNVSDGSVVLGDIDAGKVTIDGKVKGTILSKGKIHFKPNSLVVGSVTAGGIVMDDGARVNATIQLASQYNEENLDEDFSLEV